MGENAASLGYEGDALLDDFVGFGGQGLLSPVDGTVHHGGEAHDGLEDGGLAGAVGSHDGDDLAGVDVHGDVGEGAHGAVLDGYVGKFEKWRVPFWVMGLSEIGDCGHRRRSVLWRVSPRFFGFPHATSASADLTGTTMRRGYAPR